MYDPSSPLLRPVVSQAGAPNPEAKARFAEDRLLDAVIWCALTPNGTVTEADVMERFGLTKAAARSGLARLGYDGWATPQPRAGWLILPISGALIGQIIEARRIAEAALATLKLPDAACAELENIGQILLPLDGRNDPGVLRTVNHYLNRIDGIMLEASNPFTARHLRKLWHHTARITYYFDQFTPSEGFRRTDWPDLIKALCDRDPTAITAARTDLLASQETYFLRQILRDETPLMSAIPNPNDTKTNLDRREQ